MSESQVLFSAFVRVLRHRPNPKVNDCILTGKGMATVSFEKRSFSTTKNAAVSNPATGLRGYWKSLKWFSIPAGVGFAYICYLQWGHIKERERRKSRSCGPDGTPTILKDWQVDILKKIPTKSLSRIWGKLCNKEIPYWLREPLLRQYVRVYGCNMEEAIVESLSEYNTFRDFFTRKLKANARPIDQRHSLVSPVDGTVLFFGEVDPSYSLEQVKGIKYPFVTFVGPKHPIVKRLIREKDSRKRDMSNEQAYACTTITDDVIDSRAENAGTPMEVTSLPKKKKLFHCTIYLAPGDYHWFHAPTEWTVEHRRHIPGHLFSVSPFVMHSVQAVFNFNERVLLYGQWRHGPLLMAAVGAYNVGSINLNFSYEKDLVTNAKQQISHYYDRLYGARGIRLARGDDVGCFELGSSVVLIFRAPEDFQFVVRPGQHLKVGQPLGKD